MISTFLKGAVGALATAAMLAGCSSGGSQPPEVPSLRAEQILRTLAGSGAGKIDHVVFIVQ